MSASLFSIPADAERGSFAGHETFPLRYSWLRKAVQHVGRDPQVFRRDNAMVQMGVGKNMVRAIHHWAMVTGMIEENPDVPNNRGRFLRPTDLGERLFADGGWDPYFEDPGTLWVIQYELASMLQRATTWYWVFNHLPQPEFAKNDVVQWLQKLVAERAWSRVSPASIKRDVDVFLRTYVPARATRTVPLEDTLDCPLVELGLIREASARGSYSLVRGHQATLPQPVFAYALARFLARRTTTASAVPLQAVAFAPGSPGRVFALSEEALMARMEDVEASTRGAIAFHDTAGVRQVLIHRQPDPLTLLSCWYERVSRRGSAS